MTNLNIIRFGSHQYYISSELYTYDPTFFGNINRRSDILKKAKIPEGEYIYAYEKENKWIRSEQSYKVAKILIKKTWADVNVPKLKIDIINKNKLTEEQNTEIDIEELYEIPPAPEILELNDEEKFKDKDGNILEIEVRGERNCKKCYFKVKDVSDGFKMPNLQELDLDNGYFCQHIGRLLFGLINLEKLTFGSLFDKHIYDSLSKQRKLKELTFGTHFDQPLDALSLNNLRNLEKLTFGRDFNQNIDENILYEQNKLKELTFGKRFNNGGQPLGSSLYNLTKLEKLNFGIYFNQPLNDSLYYLTNLKELYLGSISYSKFNNGGQPLGNSLKSLGKLEKLYFGEEFNQPLGESLYKLTNLKELYLGKGIDSEFNNGGQPLGNSLKSLGKLEILFFGGKFNNGGQPLRDSLYNLTKLKKLSFDFEFDQPLECSLYNLTNLKELYFAFGKFNNGGKPLDKSFDTLQNLEYLSFGFRFKQKLDEVLNKLPNLQRLWIRNDDYPYSLKSKNPNLKIL
jgi:hypothetical protein